MNNNTSTTLQKAYQLIKAGHKQQAIDLLMPVVYANSENLQAWYLLGHAHTDPERRIHAFEQVLRIDPAHQPAQKQLDKLHAAAIAFPTTEAELAKNASVAQKEMGVMLRWVAVIGFLLLCCLATAAVTAWWTLRDVVVPTPLSAPVSPTVAATRPRVESSPTRGPILSPSPRPSVTAPPRRATWTPMPATPTVLSPAELIQLLTAAAPTPNMTLVTMQPIDEILLNSARSASLSGSMSSGQTISIPFEIDNAGDVNFILAWSKNKPVIFTLTTPEGQVIDAAYAKTHPDVAILGETNIGFTYYVKKSAVGTWKVNLTASATSDYEIFAHFAQTTLILRTGSENTTHGAGNLISVVVRVEDQGKGVTGAIVTARVKATHVNFQNVTFVEMGDGFYGLTYEISKISQSALFTITARGRIRTSSLRV